MHILTVIRRNPIAFPAACVASVAMMLVSEGSYRESVQSLDEAIRITSARGSIQALAQGVLDAESGQRGYLLTDRKEYLQPYRDARLQIDEALRTLGRYYVENPEHGAVLQRLRTLADAKLAALDESIRLHDEGKVDAATEVVLTDIGKGKMEAIRTVGTELMALETTNRDETRANIYRSLLMGRIGVAALTTISLLALFLYRRQSSALERQGLRLQQLMQAETDRLEVEVRLRTRELTELTKHLLSAREDERKRLARDLHDELGSLLTSAKLDAARIRSRLGGAAPEALERLSHLVETLNSSIALGRRIIEDLRPSTLSNLGLAPTLEILAREFAAQSGIEVHCELVPIKLAEHTELVIYRVVQEAVTNIAKYARAKQAWISLGEDDRQVTVTVRDDGIGFDARTLPTSAYGLLGMRYRVEAENGRLDIVSAPGQGTTVHATLAGSALPTA
jgi:signal transduction histidine kinase